jgi:hypothetical protein
MHIQNHFYVIMFLTSSMATNERPFAKKSVNLRAPALPVSKLSIGSNNPFLCLTEVSYCSQVAAGRWSSTFYPRGYICCETNRTGSSPLQFFKEQQNAKLINRKRDDALALPTREFCDVLPFFMLTRARLFFFFRALLSLALKTNSQLYWLPTSLYIQDQC